MAYEQMLLAASDPTRQRLLAALAGGPLTVGELAAQVPVSRPAVSQHLKRLKASGWLTETRKGTRHYFSVDPATALALRNHFEAMWKRAMLTEAEHAAREEAQA